MWYLPPPWFVDANHPPLQSPEHTVKVLPVSGSVSLVHATGGCMPFRQPIEHTPMLQPGMFIGHTFLQAPQLFLSLKMFTSQPLPVLLSQSANPGRHWSKVHWLFTHFDL